MKALILALGLVSSTAFATVTNQTVNCINKDGSVTLNAEIPGDIDAGFVKAEVKPKNGGIAPNIHIQKENGQIAAVDALNHGVFTLHAINREGAELIELYAFPRSVKSAKGLNGVKAEFIGKLTLSSENGMKIANVRCTTK